MNNFDLLSFNYEKLANNLSKTKGLKHKIMFQAHKMKHKDIVAMENFYISNTDLMLEMAMFGDFQLQSDLLMYESWLSSNECKRN